MDGKSREMAPGGGIERGVSTCGFRFSISIRIRKRESERRYVERARKGKIIESDRKCRVEGEGGRREERKQRTKEEE